MVYATVLDCTSYGPKLVSIESEQLVTPTAQTGQTASLFHTVGNTYRYKCYYITCTTTPFQPHSSTTLTSKKIYRTLLQPMESHYRYTEHNM
eukprot:6423685-Amphidinium_carterae.1